MNTYVNTRNFESQDLTFSDVVIRGIAPSGGLYVPEHIPHIALDDILTLANVPYAQAATGIYQSFDIDFSFDETLELMKRAYGENFDTPEIAPIKKLSNNRYVLELFHGPTSAFKDMALQCLPHFFSASAKRGAGKPEGEAPENYLILVATSGDTGKAALEGFANVDRVKIVVFYPSGGVSDIQYLQMATQKGDNVQVFGAEGNFDDCQTGVKQTFTDESFKKFLMENHKTALSSANSINWGRLMPQIVYYVVAYARMVKNGEIAAGEKIDVCVPTGNFGNILAAYYAKQIGTPINKLICASNENDVLTEFLNTGVYDIQTRDLLLTPSPSMDILVSSNLERQLFELTDRDTSKINGWMKHLSKDKTFTVDTDTYYKLRDLFIADSANYKECFKRIKTTYEEEQYLIDPHTAVAVEVASRIKQDRPILIASTAHWAKFGESVYRALHELDRNEPLPPEIAAMNGIELNRYLAENEPYAGKVPQNLNNLLNNTVRFNQVVSASREGIQKAIQGWMY